MWRSGVGVRLGVGVLFFEVVCETQAELALHAFALSSESVSLEEQGREGEVADSGVVKGHIVFVRVG